LPWITAEAEPRLHAYIVGVFKKHGCYVVAIGGAEDHVHVLFYLGHEAAIGPLLQQVKGSSSRFARAELGLEEFQWQRGYAAFGVSPSHSDRVTEYVRNQHRHHAQHDLWPAAETLANDESVESSSDESSESP